MNFGAEEGRINRANASSDPGGYNVFCPCVPITNKTRFVDNTTVTNPDTCLPLNHI